jgi:mannan endo-1,4-beta-mannosidase
MMTFTRNLSAAIVCVLAAGTTAWGIEPANPNATQDARKVLTYLYELPKRSENRIVSGHLAGGAVGPNLKGDKGFYKFTMQEIDYVHDVSGQWVGLIGADYCAGFLESPNPVEDTMYYKDINRGLIDYWNAGGLVVITTHQFDPRELHKDGGQCFPRDLPKGEKPLDISRLYTPGCEEYNNFRVIMDSWSEGLQELADHGVVVLWRPFNEVRDGKWWCNQPADQFKALYRYTFDHMTHKKGLNNLLWVFDPVRNNVDLSYYPGDDYVDIVGYTMEWDSGPGPNRTRPVPQKVFGCVEFNVHTNLKELSSSATPRNYDFMKKFNCVKENIPYCSFFMSWNRVWGPYARGTPESVKAMFNDPSVANRGELDWRHVADSPKSQ